ncbi:MAG: response regulator [Phycisphaerales bacterium]|nr:response regulator [Phycisphaerales bacterium]
MNRSKPLILIADDEVHILHVVSLKLRNAGYDIITAEDGEEAFELATARQPDLIITDFHMPYMTGLELCSKLKEQASTAATPALMLTARGFTLPAEALEQTNITGVLSKPFSPREVLARVQELIGQATHEDAGNPA